MSFSTEENDRNFIHGGGGGNIHVGGQSIGGAYAGAGGAYAGAGGAGTMYQPPSAAELLAAQTRIDNLRGIALRQAVDAQAAKQDVDSQALDTDAIIQSARQFYAFLSGDTPTSEG